MSTTKKTDVRKMVLLAIFTAFELIFCFTFLGSLPLGPGIVATLAHIPAIIAAITLGKKPALYMGFVMGISSLIVWSFMPPNPLIAFAFTPFAPYGSFMSLIISVVPRTIFPVIAALIFEKLQKPTSKVSTITAAVIAAVVSSLVHSILVLSLIYFSFAGNSDLAKFIGDGYIKFVVAWGGINAIIEIIIAGVVAGGIILPLQRVNKVSSK